MKKVSIIVPIYNEEENLRKCIESLINQTYKELEDTKEYWTWGNQLPKA